MLFGTSASNAGDADESMSIDGVERTRDGSVLVSHIAFDCADRSRIGSCVIGGRRSLDHLVLIGCPLWHLALACRQSERANWCGTRKRALYAKASSDQVNFRPV